MSFSLIPKIKEKQKPRAFATDFGYLKDKKHLETLKNASAIMLGKSGILTEGKPKLAETISLDSALSSSIDLEDGPSILQAAGLCSDGTIKSVGDGFLISGRPIEKAVLEECLESGNHYLQLSKRGYNLLDRLPFGGKFVGALYEEPTFPNKLYFSGNPEIILQNANYIYRKGQKLKKSALWQEILHKALEDKMRLGYSVVGVSYRDTSWRKIEEDNNYLNDSVFLGFLVFKDALRQEIAECLLDLKARGAKTILATGENAYASGAIMQNAGLLGRDYQIINGTDFEYLSDTDLFAALNRNVVFGRLASAHKLRISQVLQDRGELVVYIGSEMNDVEAILSSNVGIALSSGDESAKEAADMVILDDRLEDLFASFGLMIK